MELFYLILLIFGKLYDIVVFLMKAIKSKPKHKKIHRAYKNLKKTISLERNLLQILLDNVPDAIYFKQVLRGRVQAAPGRHHRKDRL
jgi:hypothetical protein